MIKDLMFVSESLFLNFDKFYWRVQKFDLEVQLDDGRCSFYREAPAFFRTSLCHPRLDRGSFSLRKAY